MRVVENSAIKPLPTEKLIEREAKAWRVMLPQSYKKFISKNNGVIPYEKTIKCIEREYAVDRFLCIDKLYKYSERYRIDVIIDTKPLGY